MALIDLTLEKPALKRTEVIESEASGGDTRSEQDTANAPTETNPKRRARRVLGAVVGLAVGVVGLVTLRKLRARRKNRGDE